MVTKPSFDAIVVKDGQSDGRLANPASANQGNGLEEVCETNYPLNQLVASKDGSLWWGWYFPKYARDRCKKMDILGTEIC